MHYSREVVIQGYSEIQLEHFEEAYFSQQYGAVTWFGDSSGAFAPMVCVYKVIYD